MAAAGVQSASSARCGKARVRALVSACGDGWVLPGDVGATQGGGRRAARPPRGRGRQAVTPGRGPGPRSARRGKRTRAVENPAPRGHVRWGRGLFGERAFRKGGGWWLAGGGEAAWLRTSVAFEEGAAAAPEVPGTEGCPRGQRPHGRTWTGSAWQRGDPSPAPSPGHRKPRAATWAGVDNPQRGESRSLGARKRAWKFEEWEKPEARIVITRESLLQAYISSPSSAPGAFPQNLRRSEGVQPDISDAVPC